MLRIGNDPAGQILVYVLEVFLQLLKRFSLGSVIWIVFQVAEPHVIILPIDVADCFHICILPQRRGPFNPVLGQRLRRKKAPGKAASQGGKGHDTVPGAIGRSETVAGTRLRAGRSVNRWSMCPKRAACLRASGQTLRGPQDSRRRGNPRCRPIHVDRFAYSFQSGLQNTWRRKAARLS